MAQLAIEAASRIVTIVPGLMTWGLHIGAGEGAGEGNRTLVTSLEG
jgi:hypothetical protein